MSEDKDLDIRENLNKYASEIMKGLQEKKLSFAEALDVLSTALVVSALNAGVEKKDFMENTTLYWDELAQRLEDNKQTNDLIH